MVPNMLRRFPLIVVVTILLLLSSWDRVSGTALPMPSACREDDGPPSYLLPSGGGISGRTMPNPVQKNEKFVLEEVWIRHLTWNKLATQMKNTVYWGRISALGLLITGGMIHNLGQTAATNGAVYKLVGSASMWLVPLINKHFANKDMVQDWTRASSISERIKGQVYLYQAAVPPYEKKDFEAVKRLVTEVAEFAEDIDLDLNLHYARTYLTQKEKIPFPDKKIQNREEYLEKRLQPQIDQYLQDATRLARKVDYLKKVEGVLIAASAAIGPLSLLPGLGKTYATTMQKLSGWPTLINSCGVSIASHYHASKYDEEAEQWSNAAYRLKNLRLKLPHDAEPEVGGSQENEWRSFVETCEQIILESTVSWTMLKNRPGDHKE